MNAISSHPHAALFTLLLTASIAPGCGDSESSSSTGGSGGTGGAASSSTTGGSGGTGAGGASVEAFYACEELEFAEARPLSGMNFDASEGGFLTEPTQSTFVAHTTQIYMKPEGEAEFLMLSGQLFGVLGDTPGLVAWTVGTDEGCGVARTMGIWESEEALYAFVASDLHAQAMSRTTALSFTGRTMHFDVTKEEAEALTWDVMREKLEDVEPSPLY